MNLQSIILCEISQLQMEIVDDYCKKHNMDHLRHVLPHRADKFNLYKHLLYVDKKELIFCFIPKVTLFIAMVFVLHYYCYRWLALIYVDLCLFYLEFSLFKQSTQKKYLLKSSKQVYKSVCIVALSTGIGRVEVSTVCQHPPPAQPIIYNTTHIFVAHLAHSYLSSHH